jgi:hypothetical protein
MLGPHNLVLQDVKGMLIRRAASSLLISFPASVHLSADGNCFLYCLCNTLLARYSPSWSITQQGNLESRAIELRKRAVDLLRVRS